MYAGTTVLTVNALDGRVTMFVYSSWPFHRAADKASAEPVARWCWRAEGLAPWFQIMGACRDSLFACGRNKKHLVGVAEKRERAAGATAEALASGDVAMCLQS